MCLRHIRAGHMLRVFFTLSRCCKVVGVSATIGIEESHKYFLARAEGTRR